MRPRVPLPCDLFCVQGVEGLLAKPARPWRPIGSRVQKKARNDREKASAAEILDNSLIDEVNKFDTAAVIKAAKEWKPN